MICRPNASMHSIYQKPEKVPSAAEAIDGKIIRKKVTKCLTAKA